MSSNDENNINLATPVLLYRRICHRSKGLGAECFAYPGSPAYPLKASGNRRYLVDQNNVPFLIIGARYCDGHWSLVLQQPKRHSSSQRCEHGPDICTVSQRGETLADGSARRSQLQGPRRSAGLPHGLAQGTLLNRRLPGRTGWLVTGDSIPRDAASAYTSNGHIPTERYHPEWGGTACPV